MIRTASSSVSGRTASATRAPSAACCFDPGQVLAQVAASRLAPGPRLVDDEPQPPPDVARPPLGESEFEGPPIAGDPVEQLRGRQPLALVVEGAQIQEPPPHRVVDGHRVGLVGQVAPPAVAVHTWNRKRSSSPQPRSGVRNADDDVQIVRRIVHRPQHHQQSRAPPGARRRASSTRLGNGMPRLIEGVLEEG